MMRRILTYIAGLGAVVLFAGCAVPTKQIDYSAYKASRPRSIVVLPPLNESPDINATYAMLAQSTAPLAESGYYVLPVALVDETFRQNGLTVPGDIHAVPVAKLREIFGADAALYVTVSEYGSKYQVLSSVTRVAASAKLVDLKTGDALWSGSAAAATDDSGNAGGGLVGALIAAAVAQVINHTVDRSYGVAGAASDRLLSAGQPTGILYGPRSPKYQSD
ncbi:DUF799 domain-containing protein [Cupriavidus metallidurans]|uniref:DUF799 domain-containing protein n=1 Tax=Cupriavidus TaxID=106589 RepID=UPI00055E7BB5|nr:MULTISPECIES: DUF799 domain-containing protein [Cupriavidus]GMG92279.1 lipoprotein [Cupriavidus sp. TKC]HBD35213.1 hypothetical protein [Cupriavidus sp.]HBO82845.1 hypothetical protein [Cupriavidus sp.]